MELNKQIALRSGRGGGSWISGEVGPIKNEGKAQESVRTSPGSPISTPLLPYLYLKKFILAIKIGSPPINFMTI